MKQEGLILFILILAAAASGAFVIAGKFYKALVQEQSNKALFVAVVTFVVSILCLVFILMALGFMYGFLYSSKAILFLLLIVLVAAASAYFISRKLYQSLKKAESKRALPAGLFSFVVSFGVLVVVILWVFLSNIDLGR